MFPRYLQNWSSDLINIIKTWKLLHRAVYDALLKILCEFFIITKINFIIRVTCRSKRVFTKIFYISYRQTGR